jgi:hypothetical protein
VRRESEGRRRVETRSIKTVVHDYYDAWVNQKRDGVRDLLGDNLVFKSPQDTFLTADEFLGKCWVYSRGLKEVHYLREIYSEDQAFVILLWEMDDGSRFADAEYIRVRKGMITEIFVVNNSPDFAELVEEQGR